MWSRFGFGSSHLFGEIVLCGIFMKFERGLGQSKPIYNAFKAIRESPDWKQLSEARKRIVESECAVFYYISLGLAYNNRWNGL